MSEIQKGSPFALQLYSPWTRKISKSTPFSRLTGIYRAHSMFSGHAGNITEAEADEILASTKLLSKICCHKSVS